jgi:hypothetical protein
LQLGVRSCQCVDRPLGRVTVACDWNGLLVSRQMNSEMEILRTCHHFQARGRQRRQLRISAIPKNWELRVSHCGLFPSFAMIFLFHSMTFDGPLIFRGGYIRKLKRRAVRFHFWLLLKI